jgi:excisionase family DNA binding protein
MSITEDKLCFSISDAAHASGLSRARLYEIIAAGELPFAKIGKRTLIRAEDLRQFIDRHLTTRGKAA